MFGTRIVIGRRAREEAEKPFWISFADLMSALMVLFLLVMSVALLAVTKNVTDAERKTAERESQVAQVLERLGRAAAQYPGIAVDEVRSVIDFGERARFDTGSSQLTKDQANALRAFVPEVLAVARDELGRKWIKRIVVEGYADPRGDYLLNLDLSLKRSQRVLCALLAPVTASERALTHEEREQVRDLFLVGGYSFNSAKKTFEESRRIELRLEFLRLNEVRPIADDAQRGDFGSCRI
ncbi:MAG TPA: flagellar motor protein MotB [Burkholderiales bacterium]|nr:flagellar motor protein MotB [Burkholderiales bacterium]